MQQRVRSSTSERGFTLLELMIVVAIIALIAASALPVYNRALTKAHKTALMTDMNGLYTAFMSYRFDNNKFPADAGRGALNPTTLEPLVGGGYFSNVANLNRKLVGRRIQTYFAPDWSGRDSDFIVVARSSVDRNLIFYVMHYDFMGFFGYDGVYVLKDGNFVRADEAI